MRIEIETITLTRQLLRRELDQNALLELAEDIKRHGQIQPIAVRRTGENTWQLVAGRRRLEAVKLLGHTSIEAHELIWPGLAELPALAENIRRKNLSPLEEADIVTWMHEKAHMPIAEIAEKTGHGTSWVQDRLAVGNLPEELKQALHEGYLRISAAFMLARIDDQQYRAYLLHVAKVSGCTTNQAEAWWLDWQARTNLTRQVNFDGTIPQPPPLPPPPPFLCFLCREKHPRDNALVVTICCHCCNTIKQAQTTPPDPLEYPARAPQTQDGE